MKEKQPTSLQSLLRSILVHKELIWNMTKRNVLGRYKGSFFGLLWSFFNPLLMLAIYTFAFSVIFQAKWGLEDEGHIDFALILFASLTIFNLFGDVLKEAPHLVLSQPNFVKKVIFPLEILPVISLLSSLIQAVISLSIFLVIYGLTHLSLPWTLVYLPLVIFPLMLISLGIAFILASIGVYFRDIGYFMSHIVTVLLFTSPVFFSIDRMPSLMKSLMVLNPIAYLLENARRVMVFGKSPEWIFLATYTLLGFILTMFGYWWFQKTRKGFADVI